MGLSNINWRFTIPEIRVKENNLGQGLAGLGQGLQTAANAFIARDQRRIAEEDRQRRIEEENRLKAIDEELAGLIEQQSSAPQQLERMSAEKDQKLQALNQEEVTLQNQLQTLKAKLESVQNQTFQAPATNAQQVNMNTNSTEGENGGI